MPMSMQEIEKSLGANQNGTSFATPNGTRYCALVFSF